MNWVEGAICLDDRTNILGWGHGVEDRLTCVAMNLRAPSHLPFVPCWQRSLALLCEESARNELTSHAGIPKNSAHQPASGADSLGSREPIPK